MFVCAQLCSSMAWSNLDLKGQNKIQCYFYKAISTDLRRLNEKSICSCLASPNLFFPRFFSAE